MDVVLPDIDGKEVTLKIRNYEEINNLSKTYICGNSAFI